MNTDALMTWLSAEPLVPFMAVVIGAFVLLMIRDRWNKRQHIRHIYKTYHEYMRGIIDKREIPTIEMEKLNPQKNEFCVLVCRSTMYEFKSERLSVGLGSRVKMGNLPVYFGGTRSQSVSRLRQVSNGRLYLTNKRIAFVGDQKTFNTRLADVMNVENGLDLIHVSMQKHTKPIIFSVDNGFIWWGLTRLLTKAELDSPLLPANIKLIE